LDAFKIAKIIKTEKHPDADRLKVCDVDVGEKI
jgi:phenylalanyl-tRNA synthetase beta chain